MTRSQSALYRWFTMAGIIVSACLFSASPSAAHQSPSDCTGNNLGLNLLKNKTQIVSGDTVHFTIAIRNDAAGACDITGANATFTCPAADGTPTGPTTACVTGASFPAGFPTTTMCEVDCVVAVNPGVASAQAKAEVHGTLHDVPFNDLDTADVVKFISVQILRCGDGLVNVPGETCDPPGSAAGGAGNTCRADCTVCGDGHTDAGEECDDGNANNNDACRNNCTFPRCGDGIKDANEQCDDGNTNNTDSCRNDCTIPRCGDGILDAGEQCDDGNANNADSCRNNCTIPRCGDGILDTGEQCDDGNTTDGDGCNSTCQNEVPCDIAVEKTCAIPQTPAPFVCSNAKPIHSLTMQWVPGTSTDPTRWVLTDSHQAVDIKAWNGTPGSTLVATRTGINPGDVITVTGFSGSVLNVYWEIFAAGTGFGTKLGNSAFHLSCSDVDMNTSDDCGKLEGDLKVTSGFTGLINDWRFEGMAGDNAALECHPAAASGSGQCVLDNTGPVDCTTQGKPTSLTFLYNGNTCANPDNSNPQGGKFLCSGSIDPGLPITVGNAQGYAIVPTTVSPGGTFTVSAATFQTQSLFTLTNAGGTETESINTSCSQVLAVGNVFGSLTLVAFNGQGAGNEVTYTYKVSNKGAEPVDDVVLSDAVGGVEVFHQGPFSLAVGETKTFQSTATITQNTINVATVTGNGGECTASGSATVLLVCDLRYPFASANPLTSLLFSESGVLRTYAPSLASAGDTIKVWYNDEHALTLGVRRVNVKTAGGTNTTDYPVTALGSNPGFAIGPSVGTTALGGDQAGTDLSGRPMFPALFITDITGDPTSLAGDWQFGGIGIPPHAVFGTWKGAVRTVDKTHTPALVTVTPDVDPVKNNWNLGPGSDTPPGGFASLANEGYGAEARWNVDDLGLLPGHVYRMQFMVHDGDQNKTGGDVGQACMTVSTPTP